MPIYCVAYGCKNSQNPEDRSRSFHRFPHKRPEILKKWIQAIRREKWQPSKYSRLCSDHFAENCYQIRPGADYRLLKEDAVPTLFKFPAHLVKNEVSRRILVGVPTAVTVAKMPGCCAVGCSNRDSEGFLMKRFPRDPIRRKLWASKVKRENWSPKDSTHLCEVHFDESQFESHRADGLRKLKPNAVPTIFKNEAPLRKSSRKQKNDSNCKNPTSKASDEELKPDVDAQEKIDPQKKKAELENAEKDSIKSYEISKEFIDVTIPLQRCDVPKTSVRGRKPGRPPAKRRKDDGGAETPDKLKATTSGRKRGRPPSAIKKKDDVCLSSPTRKSARCQELRSNTDKKEPDIEEGSAPVDEPTELSSGKENYCFVCNKLVNKGVSLHTLTNTTEVYMHQKLDKIVTEEMELIIEEQGILCVRCANLLNYIDRIEVELNMLTKAILNSIKRNYGMGINTTDEGQQDLLPDTGEIDQETIGECFNLDLQSETEKYLSKRGVDSEENTTVHESSLQEVTVADKETHSKMETVPLEEISCHLCQFKTCYKSVLFYHLRQHLKSTYWCDFCNVTLPEAACSWLERDLKLKLKGHEQKHDSCTLPVIETDKAESIPCVEVKNCTSSNIAVTLQPVNNKDMTESKISVTQENSFVNELQEDTETVKLSDQICIDEPTSLGSNDSSISKQIRIISGLEMIVTQEVETDEQTKSQKANKSLPEESLSSEVSCRTANTRVTELKTDTKQVSYEQDKSEETQSSEVSCRTADTRVIELKADTKQVYYEWDNSEESLSSEVSSQTTDTRVTEIKTDTKQVYHARDKCRADNKDSVIKEVNIVKEIGLTRPHTSTSEVESTTFEILNEAGVTEVTLVDSKHQLVPDTVKSDASLETDNTRLSVTPGILAYSNKKKRTENVADREFRGENKKDNEK